MEQLKEYIEDNSHRKLIQWEVDWIREERQSISAGKPNPVPYPAWSGEYFWEKRHREYLRWKDSRAGMDGGPSHT